MNLKQKDLVLLSYPFSDLKERKVRPALVISNNSFNRKFKDCVMVPLTTVIKNELYSIVIDQDDLDSGKLIKQSRIRVDKVFSVEKKLVLKKIGIVSDKIFGEIRKEFVSIV
jgi:mRNA interferase MazF|tara:strand:- start:1078 stop:1413 length:336 start_codon:yes stop_codon:yes gene_type:complete